MGAAAEIGDIGFNASFSFNQDGSKSLSLSANASIPVFNTGLWLNAGLGFNLNSYTGASFSRSAGVCYGASTAACAGVEVGQGFSWDRSGGFNGMTVYAEAYVTYAGVRTSVGYEHGFFGAEGRGLYAGASAYGLHAEVAQNGGFSWGFQRKFDIANYNYQKAQLLLMGYVSLNSYLLAASKYDETDELTLQSGLHYQAIKGEFSMFFHGNDGADGIPGGIGILVDGQFRDADYVYDKLLKGNLAGVEKIKLYSCLTGLLGENSFAQRLADVVRKNERRDIPVEAPTGYVNYNTVSIGGDISYRTVPSLVGSGPGTYYTIPNEKLDWVTFHGRRNHAK